MNKKTVSKYNVRKVLVDIKTPDFDYGRIEQLRYVNLSRVPQAPLRHRVPQRTAIWGIVSFALAVFVLMGGLWFYGTNLEARVAKHGQEVTGNLFLALAALDRGDTKQVQMILEQNKKLIAEISNILDRHGRRVVAQTVGNMIPEVREIDGLVDEVASLNDSFLEFAERFEALQENGIHYFLSDGVALLRELRAVDESAMRILASIQTLKNTTSKLKSVAPFFDRMNQTISDHYVKRSAELLELHSFLGSLSSFLAASEERHLALLFQNPAEIRPGGGFLGSYADLAVKNGQMASLDVRDIYDPDGQFFEYLVPPEPLQAITERWGARDANWFFDFPSSASAILSFLEGSRMYAERGVKFEGAIALNINVIQSVLEITGPVRLPEYDTAPLDKDTFLREVQREVEAGKDKQAGYPKRILQVLTPVLIGKLKEWGSTEKELFLKQLEDHLSKKDIMVFMRDGIMESYFTKLNASGALYELPYGFWGSYLAVVNANIAGGKSDAFIDQSIEARIDVGSDGGTFTNLSVTRTHRGDKEKDPWWRATNQNYIQIFSSPGSVLANISGNDTKTIPQNPDYKADPYRTYPELVKIESTKVFLSNFKAWSMQAFGKSVFATWFNVPAGKTKTLQLRYQTPNTTRVEPAEGKEYTFVFERQSGVRTKLSVTVFAPIGYRWKESRNGAYTFETDDPKGRVVISLTLAK